MEARRTGRPGCPRSARPALGRRPGRRRLRLGPAATAARGHGHQRRADPGSTPIPEGEPFTALLVGLDARTDAAGNPLPPQLLDALHAGADEGQLHTDTMILLRVPGRSGGPATADLHPARLVRPDRRRARQAQDQLGVPARGRRGRAGAQRAGRHRCGAGSTVPRGRPAEAHRDGREPHRHHDRPLRGDQPGRVRRAHRRPRWRLGLPQQAGARLLLRGRPAGRASSR